MSQDRRNEDQLANSGDIAAGDSFVAKHRAYLLPSVTTYYDQPLVVQEGNGTRVLDHKGVSYLDFFGGILTVSVGHGHPDVVHAIVDQVGRLTHMSTLYINGPMVQLAETLAAIAPGALQKSFFTNSGTEANETAILLARAYRRTSTVVALRYSYHGRSELAMALTGIGSWRHTAGVPGVVHAAGPYCYRCPFRASYPQCDLQCAQDVEKVIQTETTGEIAAFIAEPIQGVGGFITPPPEYFLEVEQIVRSHGGLFIMDEVQTAWGRTGETMFGIEHWGVTPDIMTSAKGLANGSPIGWTIATPEVADAFHGPTISTFGGNPVSCAAALATLDVIRKENLAANARTMGDRLRAGLQSLQERHPAVIGDVRGMGLMQAIELIYDQQTKEPAPDLASDVMNRCRKRGLLIGKGGVYGNVIRIAPPLNAEQCDIDDGLEILTEVFQELSIQAIGA